MQFTGNETTEQLKQIIIDMQKDTPSGGYKVSAKGALSRYGLGRFPVTLYASQWRKIIADVKSGAVEHALLENKALLAEKE